MRWRIALALAAALGFAACDPIDTSAPPTHDDAGERAEAEVLRVVDGDTIHVELDGEDVTIRFIGVDTPETVAPDQPVECFGPQAAAFTEQALAGRRLELEFDRQLIDPFDRTLAYVWLDGDLFNETLVRRGFAEAKTYPPNTKYQSALDAAETQARAAPRGLWRVCS